MAGKRKRNIGMRVIITLLLAILLLFAGFGLLFDITDIVVEGAYDYTSDEIIQASGIIAGKNLWFLNTSKAEKRISDSFPYISFVSVTRELPGTVRIAVSEGVVKASVTCETKRYVVDEDCRVTEEAETDGKYIEIIGLNVTKAKIGSIVTVDEDDETRLRFTRTVLNRIGSDGYGDSVTWLDVTNIGNISFDYMGRFTVKVGSAENLEYKLSRLEGIIAQLDAGSKGTIDISENGKSFFQPAQ